MSGQGAALGSSLLRVTAHEHSWRWWPPTSTTPPPSDILQPATGSVLICCFIKFRRKERIATCAGGSIILLSDGSAVRTKPGPGSLSRFRRFRTSASGLRSGVSKSFQRGSSWTPPASSLASLGAFRPLPAPRAAGPPGRRAAEDLLPVSDAQGEPPAPAPGYQIAYGCEVAMLPWFASGRVGGRVLFICAPAPGGGWFFPLCTRGHDAVRLPSGTRSLSLALCTWLTLPTLDSPPGTDHLRFDPAATSVVRRSTVGGPAFSQEWEGRAEKEPTFMYVMPLGPARASERERGSARGADAIAR